MGWWMIPVTVTILLVIFTMYIVSERGAEEVGLAGPGFLFITIISLLISWLVYFIIF